MVSSEIGKDIKSRYLADRLGSDKRDLSVGPRHPQFGSVLAEATEKCDDTVGVHSPQKFLFLSQHLREGTLSEGWKQ